MGAADASNERVIETEGEDDSSDRERIVCGEGGTGGAGRQSKFFFHAENGIHEIP